MYSSLEWLDFQSCWSLGETWSQTMAFHSGATWVRLPAGLEATWGKCNQTNQTEPFRFYSMLIYASILCSESDTTQWSTLCAFSNLTEQVMTGYGQNGQNGSHGSKPRPRTGIAYEAEDSLILFVVWEQSWLMKVALAVMRLLRCVGCDTRIAEVADERQHVHGFRWCLRHSIIEIWWNLYLRGI